MAGREGGGSLLLVVVMAAAVMMVGGEAGGQARDIPVTPEAAEAFNLARRLQQGGDVLGAERKYLAAIKHTPDFPHALTALADLRMDTGRAAEAEKMYLQVLRSHPTWFAAASSLGFLYMEAGQMDKAIEQLSRVAVLNPRSRRAISLRRLRRTGADVFAAGVRSVCADYTKNRPAAHN
jgi:predicted Zn-dependent protease